MIHIKVIDTDIDGLEGEVEFQQNSITLGEKATTIVLNSPFCSGQIFELSVDEEKSKFARLSSSNQQTVFWHNGKRALGERNLAPSDKFQIGKTTFQLVNFSFTPPLEKREYLKRKMDEAIQSRSPLLSLFQVIQERVERDKDRAKRET